MLTRCLLTQNTTKLFSEIFLSEVFIGMCSFSHYFFFYFSIPQEDSDYERERLPPTPPPPRRLSKRGAAFKLACLGKQDSDENPLMRKVATPLKLAQAQVSGVDRIYQDQSANWKANWKNNHSLLLPHLKKNVNSILQPLC